MPPPACLLSHALHPVRLILRHGTDDHADLATARIRSHWADSYDASGAQPARTTGKVGPRWVWLTALCLGGLERQRLRYGEPLASDHRGVIGPRSAHHSGAAHAVDTTCFPPLRLLPMGRTGYGDGLGYMGYLLRLGVWHQGPTCCHNVVLAAEVVAHPGSASVERGRGGPTAVHGPATRYRCHLTLVTSPRRPHVRARGHSSLWRCVGCPWAETGPDGPALPSNLSRRILFLGCRKVATLSRASSDPPQRCLCGDSACSGFPAPRPAEGARKALITDDQ